MVLSVFLFWKCVWFLIWRTSLVWNLLLGGSRPTGEELEEDAQTLFSFGLFWVLVLGFELVFELEDVSARRFSSDWRRVRRGCSDPFKSLFVVGLSFGFWVGFWIGGRLFCSEGLVRLAKSKKRPRRSFASGRSRSTASTSRFHHLLPSFGHLFWKMVPKSNVALFWTFALKKMVSKSNAALLWTFCCCFLTNDIKVNYCPPLDICFEKWSQSHLLPSFGHLFWSQSQMLPSFRHLFWQMVPKANAALFWTFVLVSKLNAALI